MLTYIPSVHDVKNKTTKKINISDNAKNGQKIYFSAYVIKKNNIGMAIDLNGIINSYFSKNSSFGVGGG